MKKQILLFGALLASTLLTAQITERERPSEWNQLVKGGRFMDRFQTMPGSQKADATAWGAD
ncbi:MAG: hypothetical protein ACRC8J_09305, partial [Phocaeicola sp.]